MGACGFNWKAINGEESFVCGFNDTIVGKTDAQWGFRTLKISKESFDGEVVACASCISDHFLVFEFLLENGLLFFT